MSVRVAIRHNTKYRFDKPVQIFPHIVRLRPAPHCRTPIEGYSLKVSPKQHFIHWQQDPFGNYQARLVFTEMAEILTIDVEVIAKLVPINPFDFFVDETAEYFPFDYGPRLKADLSSYLQVSEAGPRVRRWLEGIDLSGQRTVQFLVELNRRLQQSVEYVIRIEPGIQTCEETLERSQGSCRDSAWLLIQILRSLGLAARFVSGYLVQFAEDTGLPEEESARNFTALHAWVEVYLPGAGWVGLDPTSGLLAGEGHLPLACTSHPASAAPVEGATSPCRVEFSFSDQIERI